MTPKDPILHELLDLKSELAGIGRENIFKVPAGYFDGLAAEILEKIRLIESGNEAGKVDLAFPLSADRSKQAPYSTPAGYFNDLPAQILKRVKAAEYEDGADELASLSPILSNISREVPYAVPAGYFDSLEKKLAQIITGDKDQTAMEELDSISPLLSGLKKKPTYTIPAGYFENLQPAITNENSILETKIISITSRKWFRYAAAALVIGFVATIGLLLLNKPKILDPTEKSFAWVQKNMKKVSTDDINEFVELASAGATDIAKTETKDEINNLLKDVSDKEIQDFLNDTQAVESETDDDLILN
jgi:hypothetical protein